MFHKEIRRLLAFLCAAMLVWSQLAVAAYACPQFLSTAVPAAEAEMHPGCSQMDPELPLLCKAHCENHAQSSHTPSIDIPPLTLLSLWVAPLPLVPESPAVRTSHSPPARLSGASPPLRIEYQVFRN
jgi:hypothetical protein